MEEETILLLRELLRPTSRAHHNCEPPPLFHGKGSSINARSMQSLGSRRQRERQHPRDMLTLTLFYPIQFIKITDFAGNLYWNPGRVEARNTPHSTFSAQDRLRECMIPNSVKTYACH